MSTYYVFIFSHRLNHFFIEPHLVFASCPLDSLCVYFLGYFQRVSTPWQKLETNARANRQRKNPKLTLCTDRSWDVGYWVGLLLCIGHSEDSFFRLCFCTVIRSFSTTVYDTVNLAWSCSTFKNMRISASRVLLRLMPMLIATLKGGFYFFFLFMTVIQHWFICRPSHSSVSVDAGIEPRTVATLA